MTGWADVFPPGCRVVALPTWRDARLFVAGDGPVGARFALSGLYPASRPLARCARAVARLAVACGIAPARPASGPDAVLGAALAAHGRVAAMLPGTPGPTRKATLALVDERHRPVAFAKLATTAPARARLRHEHAMLGALAERDLDLAPKPLGLHEDDRRTLLVIAAVAGGTLPWTFPPPAGMRAAVEALHRGPDLPLEAHGWLADLASDAGGRGGAWRAALAGRDWPSALRHGDLTAGHVVIGADHVVLLDWEYGALDGFPWVDLAHGALQALALVRRGPPGQSRALAARWLASRPWPGLTPRESDALVRIAAFAAHRDARIDGHFDDAPLQRWRSALWEGEA